MENKNEEKKNKEFFFKLKEAWKDPKKKAGIKLVLYILFFLLLGILARVGSTNNLENKETINNEINSTTVKADTYKNKLNLLIDNNHSIKYEIKINEILYKINGTLKDNIIEGYLEYDNFIKKIVIKENQIFEIVNDLENVLELSIDNNKLNLIYILDLLEKNHAYIKNDDNMITYTYAININDLSNTIVVYTNEKNVYKIIITDINSKYVLNFDI